MANSEKTPAFRLLVLITTPKLADRAESIFREGGVPLHYRSGAEGTASNEILDMLGLGCTDKCAILSAMQKSTADVMLKRLHNELRMTTADSGIGFTMPLNGASVSILRMLMQPTEGGAYHSEGKEEHTMTEEKNVLVAAIVNRGYSEDVMDTARAAGARGGTILHSRAIANDNASGFWGKGVQEEKEIVLILAAAESKGAIMRGISEKCGMHSEAQGVVMSLPVDAVAGI